MLVYYLYLRAGTCAFALWVLLNECKKVCLVILLLCQGWVQCARLHTVDQPLLEFTIILQQLNVVTPLGDVCL